MRVVIDPEFKEAIDLGTDKNLADLLNEIALRRSKSLDTTLLTKSAHNMLGGSFTPDTHMQCWGRKLKEEPGWFRGDFIHADSKVAIRALFDCIATQEERDALHDVREGTASDIPMGARFIAAVGALDKANAKIKELEAAQEELEAVQAVRNSERKTDSPRVSVLDSAGRAIGYTEEGVFYFIRLVRKMGEGCGNRRGYTMVGGRACLYLSCEALIQDKNGNDVAYIEDGVFYPIGPEAAETENQKQKENLLEVADRLKAIVEGLL